MERDIFFLVDGGCMRNKKSFTLVETLIATVLMTISLGALAHSLGYMRNIITIARNQDIAITAAQEKMEEIANSKISAVVSNYNGHTFEVKDDTQVDLLPTITAQPPGSVVATQVADIPDLYDVTVVVSWIQSGQVTFKTINTTLIAKE